MTEKVSQWTVDYGDGQTMAVSLPHAWRQDVDVRFEGPVVYRTEIQVPSEDSVLRFNGVSYEATVTVDGTEVLVHRGIWDAFEVDLKAWSGKKVEVQVRVVKNGGSSYPVREVASGFLPFVYHTFGGIWQDVEIVRASESEEPDRGPHRAFVEGTRIYLDGEPFYMRGLLHWGWYPEVGHPNPPEDVIRNEARNARELGFNLVKFCLWIPTHRHLEILFEEGLEAWLELPLWDPTEDADRLNEMTQELIRIVDQYAHHPNILAWTIGCELGMATSPEFRKFLVDYVRNATGCPLVKDNSGGAEMYRGDLREYGTFYDFHPYCDTPFYPQVLDSLLPGPRRSMPTLLGEFNDLDVHRDLTRLAEEMPYWTSTMPELNDQGVRWQQDLPHFLQSHPTALGDDVDRHQRLMEGSRSKAAFVRKQVQEWVRSRDAVGGYVITGWRDTPVSTSGFFDDWGKARFTEAECHTWNSEDALFLIPSRRPPWVDGGNRPGWLDPYNQFAGQIFFRVGVHSVSGLEGGLNWSIEDANGKALVRGAEEFGDVPQLVASEVGEISWDCMEPGQYRLRASFGTSTNAWTFFVDEKAKKGEWPDFRFDASELGNSELGGDGPNTLFIGSASGMLDVLESGQNVLAFLTDQWCSAAPFWRESAIEFAPSFSFPRQWERYLSISGDRVLEAGAIAETLPQGYRVETMINRLDVRTYAEAPIMIKATGTGGTAIITTLRPQGGLGMQPSGIVNNAAGTALIRSLMEQFK